jgi:hypothetical protein
MHPSSENGPNFTLTSPAPQRWKQSDAPDLDRVAQLDISILARRTYSDADILILGPSTHAH